MESHIERILSGEFTYGHPSVEFPEQRLELTVFPNEDAEGVFHVLSSDDKAINGMVTASDPRLVCDEVSFKDGKAEVHCVFHGKGLEPGTVVKGDISLISEGGEYRLPFSASIIMKYPESSQGMIKNLFHFTNLARNHFDEAVNVFYSPEMINIFQAPDRRFKNLYRIFSAYPLSAINVEEFLIAIHKKSPVIYTTESESLEYVDEPDLSGTKVLKIRKSGWGYTRISVKSGSSFIKLDKELLLEQDFDKDIASLGFTINADALHNGKNEGLIVLKSFSSEIKLPVVIDRSFRWQVDKKAIEIRRQKNLAALMSLYVDYRLKNVSLNDFCERTTEICGRMTDENERDIVPRLVMTHVYLMQGRDHDAELMLSLIDNEFMLGQINDEAEGYYKYLEAMQKRSAEVTQEKCREVTALHENNPTSTMLLWLRIYLDEKIGDQTGERLRLLSEQFEAGSRSPVLYIEILRAMTERADKKSIGSISEIYALHWGMKHNIYYEEYTSAMIALSYGLKGYSGVFLNLLKSYYNKSGSVELLEAICTMLIRERGNRKRNNDDFRWFEKGVTYGLKITRLYESYLNTVPDDIDTVMPEPILMYFSIGAGVGNDRMALFYASLIRNKDKVPDILKSNEERIAAFAVKEAENKRISDNHAVIYEYVAGLIKNELASRFMLAISPLIFCHEIKVKDSAATAVVSVENGFNKERSAKITGGAALINFYGGEYDIVVEYSDMRRAIVRKGISDRALLNPTRFTRAIRFGLEHDVGQAFYVCGSGRHSIQVNQVNESSIRVISASPDMEALIRNECYFALIRHYSDNDRYDELDRIIEELNVSEVSQDVRAEIARLYVARGMHRNVYELIKEYGPEGVDPVILVRLTSYMIGEGINTEDQCLLNLAWEALKRGKYDENILIYLCNEFKGTIKELRDIWKAARGLGIDTVKIEERILSQMLYAGSFTADRDEILLSCIENGGRDKIIAASLDYISHEYFVNDAIVSNRIFSAIYKGYRENGELNDISALALLKHYSDSDDAGMKKLLSPLVDRLLEKGTTFGFFMEYREYVPSMSLYHDRTFVEYGSSPDKKVTLHYCISDEEAADKVYIDSNMDESYPGIYSDDFVLFYGEKLQYYITEESEGENIPTESGELERDLTHSGRTDSRYDMINDMLLSESVNDEASLEDLMEKYMLLTETVEEFFDK